MSASRLVGEHGIESRGRGFSWTSVSSKGRSRFVSGLSALGRWRDNGVEGKEGGKGDG